MKAEPDMVSTDGVSLVVDNFAGGGGASLGIETALGRPVDFAINHDPEAIAMHRANHPRTRHFCESVWDVDPVALARGRPVGLGWFSPDCTFHSKARGGKPFRDRDRARRRRGLAWLVVRWAKAVRPRVIMLENVEEFADWGPLLADGRPCPVRRGLTFRRWHRQLENLGYQIDMRELRACDYGAPTSRKRLFVIARCDGAEIVFPEASHGPVCSCEDHFDESPIRRTSHTDGRGGPFRQAPLRFWAPESGPGDGAGIRDSIEDSIETSGSPEQTRVSADLHNDSREAGHADGASNRVDRDAWAARVRVPNKSSGRSEVEQSSGKSGIGDGSGEQRARESVGAVDTEPRPDQRLREAVGPASSGDQRPQERRRTKRDDCSDDGRDSFVCPSCGRRKSALFRPYLTAAQCIDWSIPCPSIFTRERPLAEATLRRIARGVMRYVVNAPQPFIVPLTHQGDRRVHPINEPAPTVTGAQRGELALIAPTLINTRNGERAGQDPRVRDICRPYPTITAQGSQGALCAAFLARHYGGHENDGHPLTWPMSTITTQDHHHLVTAFLMAYYGTEQDSRLERPLSTITTRDRFGLVTVRGERYRIVDIGMRMLTPRELYRAQSFPDSYIIDPIVDGRPLTKTAQVRCCGNSVPPVVAEALVRANVIEQRQEQAA